MGQPTLAVAATLLADTRARAAARGLPFDMDVSPREAQSRVRKARYIVHQLTDLFRTILAHPGQRSSYARWLQLWSFRAVVDGAVYASAEPRPLHAKHLRQLGVRTVLTVKRTLPRPALLEQALAADVAVARINLGPDACIDGASVVRAATLLACEEHWPVLLCCDGGRHRTGIVLAERGRREGLTLTQALREYEANAQPTPRESDRRAVESLFRAPVSPPRVVAL